MYHPLICEKISTLSNTSSFESRQFFIAQPVDVFFHLSGLSIRRHLADFHSPSLQPEVILLSRAQVTKLSDDE